MIDTTDFGRFDGATLIGAGDIDLGVLRPADQAFNSVCDNLLDGGAAFGPNSILNDFSQFGGVFGENSPFNSLSLTPPQIVIEGQVVASLSVSPLISDAVDPFALLSWLGCPATPN